MSAYIDTQTFMYPLYQGDIRLEYPEIGEPFICPERYILVPYKEPPQFDEAAYQYPKELPPLKIGDKWIMQWEILTYTEAEIAQIELENERKNRTRNQNLNASGSEPSVIG